MQAIGHDSHITTVRIRREIVTLDEMVESIRNILSGNFPDVTILEDEPNTIVYSDNDDTWYVTVEE